MPSAKVLSEKKKIVEELTGKLKSQAGVLVNYSGITVNEDTELRVKMREAGVDYAVVKNTLMRFAIKNTGYDELEPILNGTTSLAVSSDDPIAPARIVKEFADKFADYFTIKGGFMDGKALSVEEVNAIASIPSLPILQARLLGTMLAPIATLAMVLKAIAEQGGTPVDSTPVVAEPAAESAPAPEAVAQPATETVAESAPAAEPTPEPVAEAAPAAEPAAEDPQKKATAKKATAKPETDNDEAPDAHAPVETAPSDDEQDAASDKKAPAKKAATKSTVKKQAEDDPAPVE